MPAFPDGLAISAALFAAATWIGPLVHLALWKRQRSSLAKVGQVIGLLMLAACLSGAGLALALLTLLFSQHVGWGWYSAAAIAAFWISFALSASVGRRSARRPGDGCAGAAPGPDFRGRGGGPK
jgi:hypothetical protein